MGLSWDDNVLTFRSWQMKGEVSVITGLELVACLLQLVHRLGICFSLLTWWFCGAGICS